MKANIILCLILFSIVKGYSQDYLIGFAGAGESTIFDNVTVENLMQNTRITVPGGSQLRLKASVSGINSISDETERALRIYPNPAQEYSIVEINAIKAGNTTFEVYDPTGKQIAIMQSFLASGKHSFVVSGLGYGVYAVRIKSGDHVYTSKIISLSDNKKNIQISYHGNSEFESKNANKVKSTDAEIIMQYNTGDLLKFTGISGNFSTVFMDIPTESKTITFSFIGCTDSDNNNYSIVTIGSQTWMAENLKTTKFNDDSSIPLETVNSAWSGISTPAYCWYDNDINNKDTYGAMYNWYAVSTSTNGGKNVCPSGWHVPSDEEWITLISSLGGESNVGGKLKETGTAHWGSPNTGATNESGFTALPGGLRGAYDGGFYQRGLVGFWWSSAASTSTYAWNCYMSSYDSNIVGNDLEKEDGLSVRCVQDIQSSDTSCNILKHNNIEYPTPNAMLVFKELVDTSLCLYDLKIYSSNFTFNSSTGEVTGINGTGQIITFYAVSTIELTDVNADGIINSDDIIMDNLVLEQGQYSFSSDYIAKTFEADFTTTANDISDFNVYAIESGIMSVSSSGDRYEITYDCLDENGLSITGCFRGTLNVIRNP
jgi:uncharacterized protein (TIGR02145 family)